MDCPAVLAEQCFVTNDEDVEHFGSEQGCKTVARIYYEAICTYFGTEPLPVKWTSHHQRKRNDTAGISWTLEHAGNTSSGAEAGMCKLNSIHRSCRKSDRKREGQLLFLIVHISYNARYAKLREVKNAHFPEFWRFSLSWLIFGLSSAVLHILHFLPYFMVLFVSCLQMLPVLCAAASVHL